MKDLITSKEVTMSSLEIAELTGKRHDHVLRDIRKMLEELEVGVLKFGETYINEQNGQEYSYFKLPRRECLILISSYSIKLRALLVDRLSELESTLAKEAKAWKDSRSLTRECYKEMCSTLANHRSICGKETKVFHYSNEAKMINQIVLGVNNVSRDNQPKHILDNIDNLSRTNISLMNAGFSYKERKDILSRSLPKNKLLQVNRGIL